MMKSRRVDIRGCKFTVPDFQEGERRERIDMFMDEVIDIAIRDASNESVMPKLRALAADSFPGHEISVSQQFAVDLGCDEITVCIHGPTLNVILYVA